MVNYLEIRQLPDYSGSLKIEHLYLAVQNETQTARKLRLIDLLLAAQSETIELPTDGLIKDFALENRVLTITAESGKQYSVTLPSDSEINDYIESTETTWSSTKILQEIIGSVNLQEIGAKKTIAMLDSAIGAEDIIHSDLLPGVTLNSLGAIVYDAAGTLGVITAIYPTQTIGEFNCSVYTISTDTDTVLFKPVGTVAPPGNAPTNPKVGDWYLASAGTGAPPNSPISGIGQWDGSTWVSSIYTAKDWDLWINTNDSSTWYWLLNQWMPLTATVDLSGYVTTNVFNNVISTLWTAVGPQWVDTTLDTSIGGITSVSVVFKLGCLVYDSAGTVAQVNYNNQTTQASAKTIAKLSQGGGGTGDMNSTVVNLCQCMSTTLGGTTTFTDSLTSPKLFNKAGFCYDSYNKVSGVYIFHSNGGAGGAPQYVLWTLAIMGSGGISEAPNDGKQYGRQSQAWTEIMPGGVYPEGSGKQTITLGNGDQSAASFAVNNNTDILYVLNPNNAYGTPTLTIAQPAANTLRVLWIYGSGNELTYNVKVGSNAAKTVNQIGGNYAQILFIIPTAMRWATISNLQGGPF